MDYYMRMDKLLLLDVLRICSLHSTLRFHIPYLNGIASSNIDSSPETTAMICKKCFSCFADGKLCCFQYDNFREL